MPESLDFSTRAIPSAKRFAQFRDFYGAGADSIELTSQVSAKVHAFRLEGLIVFERHIIGVGAERMAERVRRNQFDHFTIQLNLGGELHGDGADGFRSVGQGEILLLDMARPSRTRMPDVHLITLSIARAAIEAASNEVDRLHGLVIPAPLAAPLAARLASLPGRADQPPRLDAPDEVVAISNLLRATLEQMGLGRPEPAEVPDTRLDTVRRYIRQHISDDDLNPERVARAANLSRATLYRVFDPIGGVGEYIQSQRLAQLRDRLSDPLEHASIAALAFEAGFATEQHASRSFKRRFGLPPAEFRREVRRTIEHRYGLPASVSMGRMVSWYLNLGSEKTLLYL